MTDYAAIGNAIKTVLLADAWLGNPVNVLNIETEKRGFGMDGMTDASFFSAAELPAIAVVANAEPKTSEQATTNEIREKIKPQVNSFVRLRNLQSARAAAQTIAANVERVLKAQKSSVNDLGIDAYVDGESTIFQEFKDGDYYLVVAVTTCDVEITTTF